MKPLFPLNIVPFPGEKLNLHVFEPRYKQLVKDCLDNDRRFGIPSYVKNKIEYGTEVRIIEVTKVYDDQRMDIKTVGDKVFKVLNYKNPMKDKLYAGGSLQYFETDLEGSGVYRERVRDLINELYEIMKVDLRYKKDSDFSSYEIGHKIGFSKEQEYELLRISKEDLRQAYIITHLEKTIPVIREMERTRKIIKMNGHYRNFDPLKF